MAYLNRQAKFLSQALEWKVKYPSSKFYAGLRYEPFIYEKARKIFPNYSKLYSDDKDFTQRLVRDLRNKDSQLSKIINPEEITTEIGALNSRFETEAQLEQQLVAQTNPQETTQPRFQTPKIPSGITSFGQNLGSSTQIGFKKGLSKLSSGLGSIFGGVARGGGGVLVKAGGFAGDSLARISNQMSRGGLITGPSKRIWIGAISGFLVLFFILGGIGSGLPISIPTGEAAPIPPGAVTSVASIASCRFIHQGRFYKINSSKLQSLIEEVSAKTGVPSAALAAIAMQETPDFAFQDSNDHPAFSATDFSGNGCGPYFLTSVTGALGLMQVQPPSNISSYGTKYNPTAADLNGIKSGLSFLGRDLDSLTKNDFCNVRTSLYLGAGVMISKNGGKPPLTPEEVRTTACKYLGSCTAGGNSYADEVKQGFENCKAAPSPTLAAGECPIPNGRILCGSQFTPINSCGHCGIGYVFVEHCGFEGTKYALDITGTPAQQLILPNINGAMVQWVFVRQEAGSSQAIQAYAGREASGKQYYLQLHHTQPGSGNTKGGTSGEVGGSIWSRGGHVHVQIGEGDNLSNTKWLDTPQYMCKKR